MVEVSSDVSQPGGSGDRNTARNRNKKKQRMFQRHKAHIGSPRNGVASPASQGNLEIDTELDHDDVPVLASPSKRSTMSSAYIQAKLASSKTSTPKSAEAEMSTKETEAESGKGDSNLHVPRRQQGRGEALGRKSDLVKQIRAKKATVASASLQSSSKAEVAESGPQIDESTGVAEFQNENTEKETLGHSNSGIGDDEQLSEQTSATTALVNVPEDEADAAIQGVGSNSDLATNSDPPMTKTDSIGVDSDVMSKPKVEATDAAATRFAAELNKFVEESNVDSDDFEDPPLVDIQSEVSVTTSAFDMRSIHDHPPSPPPISEEGKNQSAENETATELARESIDFVPIDDGFEEGLATTNPSHEEEKKEKDPNENVDTTWDTATPNFAPVLSSSSKEQKKEIDIFDTSSWENTNANFEDVEGQFLRLMQSGGGESTHSEVSTTQKQVLDDVKRNLELAEGIDKVESEAEMLRATDLRKGLKPETINEDQPLLGARTCSSEFDEQLTIEQRLEKYNEDNATDKESVYSHESEASKDSSSEESNGTDLVQYIGQESDGEEDLPEGTTALMQEDTGSIGFDEVPTFAPSAAASSQNPTSPRTIESITQEGKSSNTETSESSDDSASGSSSEDEVKEWKMNNVPPPPPPGSKKKKKKKRSKNAKEHSMKDNNPAVKIPLLAPPPEEKLKKWEDQKMRAQNHLAAVKVTKQDDIEDPPTVTRVKPGVLFSSSHKSKQSKSPSAKAHSPSNMESVFTDQKMAEKVALASSAAAVTFEQSLAQGPVSETSSGLLDGPGTPVASGAFKNWLQPEPRPAETRTRHLPIGDTDSLPVIENLHDSDLLLWFSRTVLCDAPVQTQDDEDASSILLRLLEDDEHFNQMCHFMADRVNKATTELGMAQSFEDLTLATATTAESLGSTDTTIDAKIKSYLEKKRPWLKPMSLTEESKKLAPSLLAANFVSFLYLASKLSKVPSPFGGSNPFLAEIVNSSLKNTGGPKKNDPEGKPSNSAQSLIFDHPDGQVVNVLNFVYKVCKTSEHQAGDFEKFEEKLDRESAEMQRPSTEPSTPSTANTSKERSRRLIVPDTNPSPFDTAVWAAPRIVPAVLSFLGDPVAVCRVKMVNKYCNRIVSENEHMIMQDAVRVGGLSMNVRPAFWMWITLQRSSQDPASKSRSVTSHAELRSVEQKGQEGRWHHVIDRDVARSFGNMPPHKTGARLRTDSIVRALVTWGQNRIMRRGVKGGGEEIPLPELGANRTKQKEKSRRSSFSSPPWECGADNGSVNSEASQTPTDTVSDWGGVSPVASMVDSITGNGEGDSESAPKNEKNLVVPKEELALSGNFLTAEMKTDLQGKLSFILHTLAATHEDVGYCQGMDYVVAHLLRILQDTIRWKAVQGTLPSCIASTGTLPDFSTMQDEKLSKLYEAVDKSLIVEETVFRVMDTFFTNYNLRHMYWPELRCLKTCCRVFERLIQTKLPVLADHFEHHDLKVGLFALGWFQTLFLYLPSMPSATVCHMWDIWLVERSFKIFFRVATAILFLSQPILLNHELEGMMTYLNTIPDATLLKPDILIACALNIKVTNRMLEELEAEVMAEDTPGTQR